MSEDSILIKVLWVVLIFAVCFFLWRMYEDKAWFEQFENNADVSEEIIKVYYDVLKRSPSSEELKSHTKAISEKQYDYKELELRLINSDEYQRLIKTQTDGLQPETTRIIEEKDLIERIKRVYQKVRGKECPTEMYLPSRDLYIYFKYNVYKYVAMLRDTKYAEFEDAVKNDPKLSRESLIDKYLETFDDSKLNYDAAAIEEMDKSQKEGSRLLDFLESTSPFDSNDASKVNSMAMLSYLMKNIKDDEERKKAQEEEERLKKLREASAELEKQRKMLATSSTQGGCTSSQRVYLPDESKIVKTDYGVQVLLKSPPICTTLATQGGASQALPDVIVYNGLQGTDLADANDTQVGSIMPRFEYKRYIEVPLTPATQ